MSSVTKKSLVLTVVGYAAAAIPLLLLGFTPAGIAFGLLIGLVAVYATWKPWLGTHPIPPPQVETVSLAEIKARVAILTTQLREMADVTLPAVSDFLNLLNEMCSRVEQIAARAERISELTFTDSTLDELLAPLPEQVRLYLNKEALSTNNTKVERAMENLERSLAMVNRALEFRVNELNELMLRQFADSSRQIQHQAGASMPSVSLRREKTQ